MIIIFYNLMRVVSLVLLGSNVYFGNYGLAVANIIVVLLFTYCIKLENIIREYK
jgi:hypothetical protein